MSKLMLQTLKTFLLGAIALGVLIFVPAWTLSYWQAWVFIIVFGVCTNLIGVYLAIKDPKLLERRKQVGPAAEKRPLQKIVMSLAIVVSIGLLIFCALDYRFKWSQAPGYISLIGDALVAAGLLVDLITLKENHFGAANIETVEGQKVISTGLYALVRNPMYLGVLIMLIGIPLSLGSWWGLAFILIPAVPALMVRILDEEKALKEELPGYQEYMQKVRYRLIPYIW